MRNDKVEVLNANRLILMSKDHKNRYRELSTSELEGKAFLENIKSIPIDYLCFKTNILPVNIPRRKVAPRGCCSSSGGTRRRCIARVRSPDSSIFVYIVSTSFIN